MSGKIKRIEPVIVINGQSYKVCSLNFDMENFQFYYHFAYSDESKEKLWDYRLKKYVGRPEHISYHNTGRIHLSSKGDNEKKGIYVRPDATFVPHDSNVIIPLLVHSVYPINDSYSLPFLKSESYDNKEIRKNVWTKSKSFSVILFLTPERIEPFDFLSSFWLNCSVGRLSGELLGFHAGRIIVWDGWAVDYILTDLTIQIPPDAFPENKCSAFLYDENSLNSILKSFLFMRYNALCDVSFISQKILQHQ
jgi:hypothetical protein